MADEIGEMQSLGNAEFTITPSIAEAIEIEKS
jgi:hypothetical protein